MNGSRLVSEEIMGSEQWISEKTLIWLKMRTYTAFPNTKFSSVSIINISIQYVSNYLCVLQQYIVRIVSFGSKRKTDKVCSLII